MARDFKRLDAVLEKFIADGKNPGCSCAIMQGDEIIYQGQAGYADIASEKLIDDKSMFRQASTTKLFTYAILGMLYEEGKFLFSDPLSDYLPEWNNTKKYVVLPNGQVDVAPLDRPLTIKNAVAMMCGMPYCMTPVASADTPTMAAMSRQMEKLIKEVAEKNPDKRPVTTVRDEVRVMADAPVMFEPGSHWQYGFGSEITGALVEELTGKTIRENFVERVIDPLGLEYTDTYITDANREHIVTNYAKLDDGSLKPMPASDDWNMDPEISPMGARPNLITTPHDFAVFMQMLANGGTYKGRRYLGEGTVNMLHENQLGEAQLKDFTNDYLAGYGYGYGFRTLLTQQYGHNGRIGCFGWTGGAGTWVEADPVDKLSIAYMHNMFPNDELYHHHRVRAAAYGCLLGE